ncbi:unnamed protein product [Symbiodinium sp. CCMP2592]|nr:unnamed protein product [Symbiodinium sp. CCMP2592]
MQLKSAGQRGYKMFSRGSKPERGAWSARLHLAKARKLKYSNEQLQRRSNHEGVNKIRLFRRGRLFNRHGVASVSVLKLRASGNRFSSTYSMAAFLKAAFGECQQRLKSLRGKRLRGVTAAAIAMQASPATVTTMRFVVAGAFMARQAHMLARIYTMCLAKPPLFAGTRTCFDETSQVVVAGSRQTGQGQGEKAAHQIMVVKKTLCLVWADQNGQLAVFQVCPPLLLVSPSADHIWWALRNHPCLHSIRSFEELILATAQHPLLLSECDNATANVRLHHHHMRMVEDSGKKTLVENIFCHSHQTALVETAAASTHWPKLKTAVRKYIVDNAEIVVVQDKVAAPMYNQELCSMLAHSRLSGETEDSSDPGMADFLSMWNGPLHVQAGGQCKLQHYCSGCCSSAIQAKDKLASYASRTQAEDRAVMTSWISGELGYRLKVLALVDEPIRFLTFAFLRSTSTATVKAAPLLMDMVLASCSPLLASQQYLSSLLFGVDNARLCLLYEADGYSELEAFEEAEPMKVRTLRRMVLLVTSWIQVRHCDKLEAPPFNLVAVADGRADEATTASVLRKWDDTPACCLRPGMARTLKERGVCGEDFRSSEKHGGSKLQQTVQQSYERAFADVFFYASGYQGLAQPLPVVCICFAMTISGSKLESWNIVKTEYAALAPANKAFWDAQAARAKSTARMVRQTEKAVAKEKAAAKAQQRQLGHDAISGSVSATETRLKLPTAPGVPFIFNASICEADARRLTTQTSSVSRFFGHLTEKYEQATASEEEASMWPLTESNILSSLLSLKCRGKTLKDAVQQINKTSNAVAGPRSVDDRIPGKVKYFATCPGVCLNSCESGALILYRKVVSTLNELCNGFSSAAEAVRSDMLLRITSKSGARYSQDRYFLLASMAFQGGKQPRVQCYAQMDKVQMQPLHLCLMKQAPVQQSVPWHEPMDRGSRGNHGKIETCTAEQLVAKVIFIEEDWFAPVPAAEVVVRPLRFQDVSRSVVHVTGALPQQHRLTDSPDEGEEGEGEMEDRADADSAPAAVRPNPAPPDPQPRARKGKKEPKEGLFDPSEFREELLSELLSALDVPIDPDKPLQDYDGLLDPTQLEGLARLDSYCRREENQAIEKNDKSVSWQLFQLLTLVIFFAFYLSY